MLQITRRADDRRLAIADRRTGERCDRVRHQSFTQGPAQIEQRRQILDELPGKGVAHDGNRGDTGDRRASFADGVRLDDFSYQKCLAGLDRHSLSPFMLIWNSLARAGRKQRRR